MSHLSQRKENNCLNCSTQVIGRFCHQCGQENVEVKESAWNFIMHFLNDITHFDGKFFTTLKDLLLRPGFLSMEYMKGRRQRYLNPVRMYLFTSFVFFLILFSFVRFNDLEIKQDEFVFNGKTKEQVNKMDADEFDAFTAKINNGTPMTRITFERYMDSTKVAGGLHFTKGYYLSRAQYDSLLKAGAVKDNWIMKKLVRKEIEFNNKYNHDAKRSILALIDAIVHRFPQMLFLSLPFVALLLKLFYIRHKEFYFVSHGIFILHIYIFIFIAMLLSMMFSGLSHVLHWPWLKIINTFITLTVFFYLYKAMRNFYHQKRGKTILKYFLFLFSSFILMMVIFLIFTFISFYQI